MFNNKDCTYYCDKYIELKKIELDGCSENFKMRNVVFSSFNHLSIYFPEAYQHMLKVWGVHENN